MHATSLREALAAYSARKQHHPKTIELYRYATLAYERFLEREPLVSDLDDETFCRWLSWRRLSVTSETLRGESGKLRAFANYAAKRGWIPTLEVAALQPEHRIARALDQSQLRALFVAAGEYPKVIGTVPGDILLPALLWLLWDTSERIGAIYRIDRSDVDLGRLCVVLQASIRKGGRQSRWYRIRPQAGAAMQRLLESHPGQRPFAERTQNSLYKHLPRLRAMAGLPRWFTWHTLRRSHASHLTALGGDARRSLGHSSEAMTDRYRDPRIANAGPQPCDLLFDPLAVSPKTQTWWRRWIG